MKLVAFIISVIILTEHIIRHLFSTQSIAAFSHRNCKTPPSGKEARGHIIVLAVLVTRLTQVKGQRRLEGQKGSAYCILSRFEKAGCVCLCV